MTVPSRKNAADVRHKRKGAEGAGTAAGIPANRDHTIHRGLAGMRGVIAVIVDGDRFHGSAA